MKRYYTLDEARRIDKLIFDLAFYDITKGLIPTEVTQDAMMALHKETSKQFNYFKKLVKSGEYSVVELERDIVDKYCAEPSQKKDFDLDRIDEFVEEWEKEEKEKDEYEAKLKQGTDSIMGMVSSMLSGSDPLAALVPPLDSSQDSSPQDQLDESENCDGDEFNDENDENNEDENNDWGWK